MADAKKLVKFGASGFEYGIVDDTELVKETRKMPGLSSMKMDLKNELKTIAADDGPYVILSGGITEATELIEIYDVDSQMKQDLYGIRVVSGVEIYPKNLTPSDVATIFRTKLSNGKYVWVGMLKGKFSLPSMDQKTVDGTPDPAADSIEGSFVPRGDEESGNVVLIGREDNEGFDFEQFHKWVFPTTEEEATIPDTDTPPTPQIKHVTAATLNKTTVSLEVGASETLNATVTPTDAADKTGMWVSDKESIATVDSAGKVTAVAEGSANITFTTKDGSFTAKCAVTVTAKTTA